MDRQRAIEIISALYPADSQYIVTAEMGESLLKQAQMEVEGWQYEPTPVLVRYAQLCEQEERRALRRARKFMEAGR